eukprot:4890623-Ditylum_brightwellii.AAC.1
MEGEARRSGKPGASVKHGCTYGRDPPTAPASVEVVASTLLEGLRSKTTLSRWLLLLACDW